MLPRCFLRSENTCSHMRTNHRCSVWTQQLFHLCFEASTQKIETKGKLGAIFMFLTDREVYN